MKNMTKNWLVFACAIATSLALTASPDTHKGMVQSNVPLPEKDYVKKPMRFEQGDCALTIGGKTSVEHFVQKNAYSLNSLMPDEMEFFKHKIDMTFDFAYGEKQFEHKAVQAYVNLQHKGVWGRGAVYADSDASSPVGVKLSKTVFGSHKHTNGKPMVWIKDGWLAFSANAIAGAKGKKNLHFLKLGWFPFLLGRGIAFGPAYGIIRNGSLGLYSYAEDKSAPGINLTGELVADILSYDLYYAKFEERNKGFGDTTAEIRQQIIGSQDNPIRGVGKDNEVVAGRLKWRALHNSCGTLKLEPFAFYNEASDQMIEVPADAKTEFGSYGLNVEHKYHGFEIGGECAFNFGTQHVRGLDRNVIEIKSDNATGNLVQQYSHIGTLVAGKFVASPVGSGLADAAALIRLPDTALTVDTPIPNAVGGFVSKAGRIRPAYDNKLAGWMGVVDMSYTFDEQNLTLATAYGFASGDRDPSDLAQDKTYKGFIGLHEVYSGKRVKSVYFLDERAVNLPSSFGVGDNVGNQDLAFTDLQHVGLGASWKPTVGGKKLLLNPNIMNFWKTHTSKKFDTLTKGISNEDASRYLGLETNVITNCELLPDLNIYGKFAVFVPGQFFKDIKGMPINTKFSDYFEDYSDNDLQEHTYGMGSNTAFHMNIGFDFSF